MNQGRFKEGDYVLYEDNDWNSVTYTQEFVYKVDKTFTQDFPNKKGVPRCRINGWILDNTPEGTTGFYKMGVYSDEDYIQDLSECDVKHQQLLNQLAYIGKTLGLAHAIGFLESLKEE